MRERQGAQQHDVAPQPEQETLTAELKDLIWQAIDRLPDKSREVLLLREFDGLRYREIAQVLAIPEGTVMSRLHQARERLRRELEDAI